MTVKELKSILEGMGDDAQVSICVETPGGWVCPDGATVGIKGVYHGFDWHMGEVLVVPEYKLDIRNVEAWSKRREDKADEIDTKKFNEVCKQSLGGLQTFK